MQPYSESLQTTYNTNYPVVVETYKLRVKQLEEQLKIARHKIRHYKRLGSSH